ncbi:MAG: hypothetical protein ACI83P_000642, partial [Janthinobacterium sp.]
CSFCQVRQEPVVSQASVTYGVKRKQSSVKHL